MTPLSSSLSLPSGLLRCLCIFAHANAALLKC